MKFKGICAFALFFAVATAFGFSASLSLAQSAAEFQLGFKALAGQIPDVVGAPIENEHFNPLNGNAEQRTTKGLMVWRKGDNWTAFTDGTTTWISGPAGVQSRLNTERFLWENTPVGAEVPRPAVQVEPKQAPVAAGALVQGSGAVATGVQVSAPAPAPTQAPATAPAQVPVPVTPAAQGPAGTSKEACLACHGPFEKIVSATANYTWPSGAKENPHQNIPHESQVVPECTTCHKTHPTPPTAADISAIGKTQPALCLTCHGSGF